VPRDFHITDILTVTTGNLVSSRHMDGVYDILNYLTGDNLFTHQIPRALTECAPPLLRQHPQLAAADTSGVTPENLPVRTAEWVAAFGEMLPVAPLPQGAHEFIDPILELAEKIHPSRIAVVRADSPE